MKRIKKLGFFQTSNFQKQHLILLTIVPTDKGKIKSCIEQIELFFVVKKSNQGIIVIKTSVKRIQTELISLFFIGTSRHINSALFMAIRFYKKHKTSIIKRYHRKYLFKNI